MTQINTVQRGAKTYTTEELQQMLGTNLSNTSKVSNASVFEQTPTSPDCKDGKDDGKIGLWEGIKSVVGGAFKGIVNGIKGMFTDENGNFSLGKTLKSALTVAACFIPGVGPFIAGGLCAYGAVKGGIGIAKGVAAAAGATTDGEKRAALESIGGNGVATALSVAGLKASVGQIAANAGVANAASNGLRGNIKALAEGSGTKLQNITTNLKNSANVGNYYGAKWGKIVDAKTSKGITGAVKQAAYEAKGVAIRTAGNVKNAFGTVKNKGSEYVQKFGETKPGQHITKGIDNIKNGFETLKTKTGEHIPQGAKDFASNVGSRAQTLKAGLNAHKPKFISNLRQDISNAAIKGYKGLPSSGNVTTAALATGSTFTTAAASDQTDAIAYANQGYTTADTQLNLGYNLMSPEELDARAAQIMKNAYRI